MSGLVTYPEDLIQVSQVVDDLKISAISVNFDNGSSTLAASSQGIVQVPFDCEIQSVTLLSLGNTGSVVIDIYKDTYANFPPTSGDTITASAKPTITSSNKSMDSTLTGWTTTINAGDILLFNIDSVSTLTNVLVTLKVIKI